MTHPLFRCATAMALAAALPALLCAAPVAQAQTYPTKVVRITSPYASGQGPDLVARVFADKLAKLWGQQVIVDARPGANGFIAMDAVKKAPPDGHDLLVAANSHLTINPSLFAKVSYDPVNDFAPVAMQYRTPFFFAVSASGRYRTVNEVLAAARANPGKLTAGVPYIGSPAHLGGVMLEGLTGTQYTHVPFKENAPLFVALVNNDLDWTFATPASAGAFLKGGKVKFLAIGSKRRFASYPDIPTLAEAGGPAALEVGAWVAFVAPRGTPSDLIALINRDVNRVLADQEVKERFAVFGFDPAPGTPAELAEIIRADLKMNAEVIKRAGMKPE
ncbi:MAG: tripartite tricarboxylate transporter substrate binding protein [Betaproteobacteria bacterium]|nr:tripartite tricarboxylate transporter substrate binding protein [Betaproteobacteria bacterium]